MLTHSFDPKLLEIVDQHLRLLKEQVQEGEVRIMSDGVIEAVGFDKSPQQNKTFFSLARGALDVDGDQFGQLRHRAGHGVTHPPVHLPSRCFSRIT